MNTKTNGQQKLARPFRVGLVGDPFFWGHLDFHHWLQQGVDLDLIGFTGTSKSREKDLVLIADETKTESQPLIGATESEELVPELLISRSDIGWLNPVDLTNQFTTQLKNLSESVIDSISQHSRTYLNKEKIIAKYGTEIIRICQVLKMDPIHIQNDALLYLMENPWRNETELGLAIARLAFYANDNVLRLPFVKDEVYNFSVSVRGVANCENSKTLIHRFLFDTWNRYSLQETLNLTQCRMERFALQRTVAASALADQSRSQSSVRRAA